MKSVTVFAPNLSIELNYKSRRRKQIGEGETCDIKDIVLAIHCI